MGDGDVSSWRPRKENQTLPTANWDQPGGWIAKYGQGWVGWWDEVDDLMMICE